MTDPAQNPPVPPTQSFANDVPPPAIDPLAPFMDGTFDPTVYLQGTGAFGDPATAYPSIRIPTGDELYNTLMGKIEPELTTAELPVLDARYKDETPEQSKARARRYEKAFAEYDRQLQSYMGDLQAKLKAHQRIAMSSAELGAKAEEEEALTAIESSIAKSN